MEIPTDCTSCKHWMPWGVECIKGRVFKSNAVEDCNEYDLSKSYKTEDKQTTLWQ